MFHSPHTWINKPTIAWNDLSQNKRRDLMKLSICYTYWPSCSHLHGTDCLNICVHAAKKIKRKTKFEHWCVKITEIIQKKKREYPFECSLHWSLTRDGAACKAVAFWADTKATGWTYPVKIEKWGMTCVTQLPYPIYCTLPHWHHCRNTNTQWYG